MPVCEPAPALIFLNEAGEGELGGQETPEQMGNGWQCHPAVPAGGRRKVTCSKWGVSARLEEDKKGVRRARMIS